MSHRYYPSPLRWLLLILLVSIAIGANAQSNKLAPLPDKTPTPGGVVLANDSEDWVSYSLVTKQNEAYKGTVGDFTVSSSVHRQSGAFKAPGGSLFSFGGLEEVDDPSVYPARVHVKIQIYYTDGDTGSQKTAGCSGTLIDSRHVITAGHCVYQDKFGGWAPQIRVYPAWDGVEPGHPVYKYSRAIKYLAFKGWTKYR